MKTKKVKALQNITLFVQTDQEDINLKLMSGKMLVNTKERCSLFVPNKPRGPQSAEVMRTQHTRTVRRISGEYSISMHFSADEYCIDSQLVEELESIFKNPLLNLKKRAA